MTLNNDEERRAWCKAFNNAAHIFGTNERAVVYDKAGEPCECFFCYCTNFADSFIEEYRARLPKAEEPTGPDWATAPEWAEWWAQDSDEASWYLEEAPELHEGSWYPTGIGRRMARYLGPYVYPGDWSDSKQRRPK